MEAIQRTRNSSSDLGMFVVAIAAALIAGATGGYIVRALTSHVPAPVPAVVSVPVKAADLLPAWVQNYNARAETTRFKVDELITSLDQTQTTVRAGDLLPAWVQQYVTPAAAPQLNVEELMASFDSAAAAGTKAEDQLPTWVQRYLTPDEGPRFKVDEFIASLN